MLVHSSLLALLLSISGDAPSASLDGQALARAQTEAARAAIASFRALGGRWDARQTNGRHEAAFSELSVRDYKPYQRAARP
jgi:hypothetical protein